MCVCVFLIYMCLYVFVCEYVNMYVYICVCFLRSSLQLIIFIYKVFLKNKKKYT